MLRTIAITTTVKMLRPALLIALHLFTYRHIQTYIRTNQNRNAKR